MGFITDALAPKNRYQAQQANLDKSNYGSTIDQAQQGALNQGNFNTGFGAQQGVLATQQGIQGQLGDIAAGKGPNPAQQMLKQQTSQNINTAAGQAASARGINPALAARMAVDAAGGANQQAAGQGATLQAQQSLGAIGQQVGNAAAMGQTAQGMTNAGLGQQAIQNQVLGTAGGLQNQQNNANIANTLGTNQINAGVAAQNTANSAGMLGGLMNAAGGAMALSDEQAKSAVVRTPGRQVLPGVPQATFEYNGFPGRYEGVIAQDVNRVRPDLVQRGPDGLLRVDASLAPRKVQKMAQGGPVAAQGAPGGLSPVHAYLDSLSQVSGAPTPPQGVQGFAGGGMAMPSLAPAGGLQAPADMGGLSGSTMMPTAPQLGSPALGIQGQAPVVPGGPTDLQAPAWASESPSVGDADRSKQEAAAQKMGTAFSGMQEGGLNAFDRFSKMSFPGMHLAEGGEVAGTPVRPVEPYYEMYHPSMVRQPIQAGPPAKVDFLPYSHPGQMMVEPDSVAADISKRVDAESMADRWQKQGMTPGDVAGLSKPSQRIDPVLFARAKSMMRENRRPVRPVHEAEGGPIPFLSGGPVPGEARVPGNSEANDTVPALLSPGEVVIPRDLAQRPDAPAQAAAFVAHLMRGKGRGYGKVLKARGAGRRGKR